VSPCAIDLDPIDRNVQSGAVRSCRRIGSENSLEHYRFIPRPLETNSFENPAQRRIAHIAPRIGAKEQTSGGKCGK
jgi:hypothetical protein